MKICNYILSLPHSLPSPPPLPFPPSPPSLSLQDSVPLLPESIPDLKSSGQSDKHKLPFSDSEEEEEEGSEFDSEGGADSGSEGDTESGQEESEVMTSVTSVKGKQEKKHVHSPTNSGKN